MAEEEYRLHASVRGLEQFESDTRRLQGALTELYQRIQRSVASDLGADQIARLREQAAGLRSELASSTLRSRQQQVRAAEKAYLEAPDDKRAGAAAKLSRAHDAALRAEQALLGATASLAGARQRRARAEAKADEQPITALLGGAVDAQKNARQVGAIAGRVLGTAREAERDIDRQLREHKQERDKAKAERERQANMIAPGRIDELTRITSRPYDASSAGRLAARAAQQEMNVEHLDQQIAEAKALARTGAVEQAEMERRLGRLAMQRYMAGLSLVQTQDLLHTALREHADAERSAAISARQGVVATARSDFMTGFRGASDVPYLQQAGQAAKFSLLYGAAYKALFAVTQTFQAALQEGIEFQQGLSDMAIATGRPKEELGELAERLAGIAADAGTSPAAGLQIGARSIGLYGLAGSPDAGMQDYVAELSTRVISKMAIGAKDVDPVQLQQNIAAVTQALGLGAGGQIRVADLDAYFSKRFGTAQGGTLEAAAQSSSVGISAGFSLEEIQAMAALMISRTGQSSNAVGGYMAQIFSRGGEGSLTSVAQKYGIETSGRELADVFRDLSALYRESGSTEQTEISAAFGRGKVQNAVVAALQSWGEVAAEARKAQSGAADGALDDVFRERLGNIGGQINILMGHLREFAHLFGEAGLLSILGAGIVVLDKTVVALNSVLELYNQLPPALRDFIGVLLAGAAIGKVTGAGSVAAGALRGQLPVATATRLGLVSGDPRRAGAAVMNSAGDVRAVQVGARGVAEAGKAALATVGPWAAAAAGLLAVAEIGSMMRENKALIANSFTALNQTPGAGASAGQLRNYASELDAQAKENRNAGGWFRSLLTFGQGDKGIDRWAGIMEEEAKRIRGLANRTEDPIKSQPVITGFSADELEAGLDAITARGGVAADRVNALARAIGGLGEETEKANTRIEVDRIAGDIAGAARRMKGISLDELYSPEHWAELGEMEGLPLGDDLRKRIGQVLTPTEMQNRLKEEMARRGLTDYRQITPDIAGQVSESVGFLPQSIAQYGNVQEIVNDIIKKGLLKAQEEALAVAGEGRLNVSETVVGLNQVRSEFAARREAFGETDYGKRIASARREIRAIRNLRTRSEDPSMPRFDEDINRARRVIAENQIARLEALRRVAVQNARSQRQATRLGMGYVRREIAAAIRSGDRDLLAQVVSTAGRGAIRIAEQMLQDAIEVATTAKEIQARLTAMREMAEFYARGGVETEKGTFLQAKKDPGPSKQRLRGMRGALKFTPYDPNADSWTEPAEEEGEEEEKDSPAQIRAARAAARAARRGGDIAAARAAIVQARADMADAKKGTVEWYQALASLHEGQRSLAQALGSARSARAGARASRLGGDIAPARAAIISARNEMRLATRGTAEWYGALGSYFEARQQLSEALAANRRNRRLLGIDITDPVAQARLDLQEARRQLRRHRGRGRDVRNQDRVAIRESQVALEAASFNQRLSDVQTAEQLGRVSHTAYIRYLQNEHNRLSSIAKRTRQQQDQLNQIDQLMLEAQRQMSGQWNIGDIKLPTPYEVRRYIQEKGGVPVNSRGTSSLTTVYINGADTGMVKQIITQTVGQNARVMTVTPRRN